MRKNVFTGAVCIFLLGVFVMGCIHRERTNQASDVSGASSGASGSEDHDTRPLLNRKWDLESLGPVGSEEAIGASVKITLEFDEDRRLQGSAGCNRYFGGYELGAGNSLSIGKTGSTMMMCPDEIMNWEGRYLQALENITSYRIENNRLLLFTKEKQEVLVFAHKESTGQ